MSNLVIAIFESLDSLFHLFKLRIFFSSIFSSILLKNVEFLIPSMFFFLFMINQILQETRFLLQSFTDVCALHYLFIRIVKIEFVIQIFSLKSFLKKNSMIKGITKIMVFEEDNLKFKKILKRILNKTLSSVRSPSHFRARTYLKSVLTTSF